MTTCRTIKNRSGYIESRFPFAAFTFLASDVLETGLLEEHRLKRAVLQHAATDWRDGPALVYQRSSAREALGAGGLSNCLILILFNMLFFSATYVAFLRYDVR